MEIGEKCICQYDDWCNAFGDRSTVLRKGMRLTVSNRKTIAGLPFFSFEEIDGELWFWSFGFKSIKTLN